MSVRNKFIIVALCFALASSLIIYVYYTASFFWLLIPGVIGVAAFGPWSYYLYAKIKGKPERTNQEIIDQATNELEMKEKK